MYQHEVFDNQRFSAQIDFFGLPFDEVKRTSFILAEDIILQVKNILSPRKEMINR
ncbi:hypothetical protein ACF3NG_09515 [Aerococcaceae bacterium WGS1372]